LENDEEEEKEAEPEDAKIRRKKAKKDWHREVFNF
jgi:hypothetical protein